MALVVSAARWLALLWRQLPARVVADVVVTMNTLRIFGTTVYYCCNTTPHHFRALFGGDITHVEQLPQVEQIPL
tara:strand:+ start:2597 stop:2818 length:222 start_codon:yes stop_codon:yes gene_type:complete